MRILMVSMFAGHFFNWTDQLKDSGHEILWIDIFDNGQRVEQIDWVKQTVNWKRKFEYPGRQFLKKNLPSVYKALSGVLEKELPEIFEQKLEEFKPDVVQSFVLFSACAPILEIMRRHLEIKWIYSAWGNDLYYFQNEADYLRDIKNVLPRLDYMFADCKRDHDIAVKYGFRGVFLGDFPGGGGYEINSEEDLIPPENRKVILVKGYQELFGECIPVLKVLQGMRSELSEFEIIVFGAESQVVEYVEGSNFYNWPNFNLFKNIGRGEVLELMRKAKIYIGNSISDGMPNTLLEAIISGAFPIQSNPGGASAEIIENGLNGLLIEDPLDQQEIRALIVRSLNNKELVDKAFKHNLKLISPKLEREYIRARVLEKYEQVENDLSGING